jgi:uncharacterized protein YdhG (YjbR/CyaY superfamily)
MPSKPAPTVVDVERYLAALPHDQRTALEALRATIRSAAPGSTETISYGLPTFKHDGRPLVAYGAFKHHCSLFPMSSSLIQQLGEELEPFATAKGTIRFQPDAPLPADLVTTIVEARIAEIEGRSEP